MTKRNLIIVIILLSVIDLVAAGWYMSRRIEASGRSQNLFEQRDSTETIAMADTVTSTSQADVFGEMQHNTYYFIANTPTVAGDNSSRYTSIKHVKVQWPEKVNGNDDLVELNKELISKAFGNSQSKMKDARYVYLNTPVFNKPVGDDYQKVVKAPTIVPTYGNVTQVLVYPYMTSQRLLVMEVDKMEYNGNTNIENSSFVHYDRQNQHVLTRMDILSAVFEKENKLLKVINKKIDELNKSRGDNKLQHALNVPAEVCCSKNGIIFLYKHGTISSSPIEIMIDYDKLEPFLTHDFKQLVNNNEGYSMFKDKIKPEPINPAQKSTTTTATQVAPAKKKSYQSSHSSGKYNNNYNYKYRKYTKPKRTSRKRYNEAASKSGHHGYAGQRHWKHRRR